MKKRLIILFICIGIIIGIFLIWQIYHPSLKIYRKGRLEILLSDLIDKINIDGDCLSYSLYYKNFLNKNYPKLDVRKIPMAGICPIGTEECGEMEGIPHTYLIVNGYGAECILDQKSLACIQVRG